MFLKTAFLSNPSILKNVKILTVDNDRDSGDLYAALFEHYDVTLISTESIKNALDILNHFAPDVLICEARFLGESVYPLLSQIRSLALNRHHVIPIFVVSTFPVANLAEHLKVNVEAYQIKPLDLARFVDEVWYLARLSQIALPFSIQDLMVRQQTDLSFCSAEMH